MNESIQTSGWLPVGSPSFPNVLEVAKHSQMDSMGQGAPRGRTLTSLTECDTRVDRVDMGSIEFWFLDNGELALEVDLTVSLQRMCLVEFGLIYYRHTTW